MSHLIQAIDIDGTRYCVKHGASTPKWRTVAFTDEGVDPVGGEDNDEWEVPVNFTERIGLLTFGTSCIWKATIRFILEASSEGCSGDVTVNDTLIGSFSRDDDGSPGEHIDFLVDLSDLGFIDRPCGNIWRIGFIAWTEEPNTVPIIIKIIDVTFGPPV
jgi:hypothetical protein